MNHFFLVGTAVFSGLIFVAYTSKFFFGEGLQYPEIFIYIGSAVWVIYALSRLIT